MKFFNLCLLLCLFLMSCSSSEEQINPAESSASESTAYVGTYRLDEFEPSNSDNPYDVVGSLHVEMYKAYYALDSVSTATLTVTQRALHVAQQNENFISLSTQPYTVSNATINSMMEQVACCSSEVIRDSVLTSEGHLKLQIFMGSVVPYCIAEDDFAAIYEALIAYENTILEAELPITDKQVLLSVAAVVRYVSYERKKRPKKNTDPDWDLMVWRIAGAAAGANEGIQDAIVYSIVCGVLENGE